MSATTKISKRANLKQKTNADLPINPAQPVTFEYIGVTTLSQTVITLPFAVDQLNKKNFLLIIDGKTLTEGASNDYQFTAIQSNNTSSQVTLSLAQDADLNIRALYLGVVLPSPASTSILNLSAKVSTPPTITKLTSGSGTYIPPAGAVYLKIKMVGAGGGGGGADTGTGGPGGGAGGYIEAISTVVAPSYAYSIGTGGGGGATNSAGTAGGNTTFGTNTASGGSPGQGGANGNGGAGGAASVGSGWVEIVAMQGNGGQGGLNGGVGTGAARHGGVGVFGGGARSSNGSGVAGIAAQANSGSGGNGGNVSNGAGGAGGSGMIIIEEHYTG